MEQGLARYKAFMEINDALTALKESKFIISQPKMNTVLKIITDNDVLFGLVNECNENFDYDKEYKRAVTSFKDGERFILPSGRKKVIALVTGLLFEFNMKTLDFHKFILTYFTNANSNIAFSNFCDKIISPYISALKEVLVDGLDNDMLDDEENYTPVSNTANDALAENIYPLLNKLNYLFVGDNGLDDKERQELTDMVNGLILAAEMRDMRIIRAVWYGLRVRAKGVKNSAKVLEEIQKTLKMYLVL